jgi:hypothetical protein
MGIMISVRRIVPLIGSVLLISSCDSSTVATAPERPIAEADMLSIRQADGEWLPIRGEYQATVTGLFAPGQPGSAARCSDQELLTLAFVVEGRASHLGGFAGDGSNCTAVPVPGPVPITDGMFAITVSNGDGLVGTFRGNQGAVGADGSATFENVMEFTGGTGRFIHATGILEEQGTIDFNTGTATARLAGWIVYDASDRSR